MPIDMVRWGVGNDPDATFATEQSGPPRRPSDVWAVDCHYCGYRYRHQQAPPDRCPKCGGSAWELIPKPAYLLRGLGGGRAEPPERNAPVTEVRFRVGCRATQVYLLVAADHGAKKMIPMIEMDGDEWEACLQLAPGTYRYRFCADNGEHVTYFSPSHATQANGGGDEARLLVPADRGHDSAEDGD